MHNFLELYTNYELCIIMNLNKLHALYLSFYPDCRAEHTGYFQIAAKNAQAAAAKAELDAFFAVVEYALTPFCTNKVTAEHLNMTSRRVIIDQAFQKTRHFLFIFHM